MFDSTNKQAAKQNFTGFQTMQDCKCYSQYFENQPSLEKRFWVYC